MARGFICVTCLIRMHRMTHSYLWHASFICVTLTHTYMWHDSLIYVTCLIHTCDMTHSYVWHASFIRVTWLMHVCDMTLSYVWHDAFICVTWLYTYDTTQLYEWHDSCICVTWLIHMRDMNHSYAWHDLFICVTWLTHICDMTRSYWWRSFLSFIPVLDPFFEKKFLKRKMTFDSFFLALIFSEIISINYFLLFPSTSLVQLMRVGWKNHSSPNDLSGQDFPPTVYTIPKIGPFGL